MLLAAFTALPSLLILEPVLAKCARFAGRALRPVGPAELGYSVSANLFIGEFIIGQVNYCQVNSFRMKW